MNPRRINGGTIDALEALGLGEALNAVGEMAKATVSGDSRSLPWPPSVRLILCELQRLRHEMTTGRHH